MPDIELPSRINDVRAYRFVAELEAVALDPEPVLFDFSKITFATPFATLVVATAIRRLRDARNDLGLVTHYKEHGVTAGTRPPGSSYLAEMGFYDFVGINEGKRVGEAKGSSSYVPITRLTRGDLPRAPSDFYRALEGEAERLAHVLFPDERGSYDAAKYCFLETIRNTFEHGDTPTCIVFAQAWPRSGGVAEVAVLDWGRGVQESLAEVYPAIHADDAVRKAVLPGVTGNPEGDGSMWQNAGYGLYVMSELGSLASGEFVLWSSDVRLTVSGRERLATTSAPFEATVVKIRVNTSDVDYAALVKMIVQKGETARPESVKRKGASKSKFSG
jgi:hypothetical protein